jgi:threonyl-tRNA synthetase
LDYQLPERFELTYVDENGDKVRPVVIHRAILGSLDRFVAFLLEETKGNFPLWLAPKQVVVLPVNNKYHEEYAKEVVAKLRKAGFRTELDNRDEKLGYRIREAQIHKIPYELVLGNSERDEGTVTYRLHGEQKQTTVSFDEFVSLLNTEVEKKTIRR